MHQEFLEYLQTFNEKFNKEFDSLTYNEAYPNSLRNSIKYIVKTGGKRLRPFLVCESAKLFDVSFKKSIFAASSIEMVHCYSLIHDDLPAMDDDNMRRGFNTLHKEYDEAIAILTGDSLLTDAFYILAQYYKDTDFLQKLVLSLSKYSGGSGMVGGQFLDLYPISDSIDEINNMNNLKTGALIKCSLLFGTILGNVDKDHEERLIKFGDLIGKAFQISDDILDVNGNENIIGKKIGKDKQRGKLTLIDHYGVDGAHRKAIDYIEEAKELIEIYGDKAKYLYKLSEYIISRRK